MRLLIIVLTLGMVSCAVSRKGDHVPVKELPEESKRVLGQLPRNIVIAHRGTTYWAPEETEAAMRWARNTGADYLELDLQRTKDSVLIALHDMNLERTTNIKDVFPERAGNPVSDFTLEELWQLDAGSWFNRENPDRARSGFSGLDILTLEDVVRIAEGSKIKRDGQGRRVYVKDAGGKIRTEYEPDSADNGNRPGIYPETKEPQLFPGIEQDLVKELERLGWYDTDVNALKRIPVEEGLVGIANTPSRVILQTFSDESLAKLKTAFPRRIPTCFLLWRGDGDSDLKSAEPEEYAAKINYGVEQGAVIIGPSIAGAPNDYDELLEPWQGAMIYRSGMAVHPYSFDTEQQMAEYTGIRAGDPAQGRADGMFTNKSDLTIRYYNTVVKEAGKAFLKSNAAVGLPDNLQEGKKMERAEDVLDSLGY